MCDYAAFHGEFIRELIDQVLASIKRGERAKLKEFWESHAQESQEFHAKLNECPVCEKMVFRGLLERMDLGWKAAWCLRTWPNGPLGHEEIAKALKISEASSRVYVSNAQKSWNALFRGVKNE